jgi:hypothetical protein
MSATAERASVRLEGETVLRIRDGRGTRLRCAGGIVWITQEGSANDTVLETGSDVTLEFDGTTLAGSSHGMSVVVEVHAGAVPPALVDTVTPAGTGRRLLPSGSRLIAALRRGVARVSEVLHWANAREDGFDDLRALEWSHPYPSRGMRRAAMFGRDARSSITEQSTLWRHI